jgi:gustatory receptor
MIFLIGRTFAMFMFAAQINDESIKPLAIFRAIPSDAWSSETQRICNQIQKNGVALTGKKFFQMQRAIVISIAGTIM